MKTYLTYKNQIEGFKDVASTVKTVEKIAAVSIHFLKQEVISLNSYTLLIEKTLNRLQFFYQEKSDPLLQKNKTGRKALVILTGDRGLVDGLWHEVVGAFLDNKTKYQSLVVYGAKAISYLAEENIEIMKSFTGVSDSISEEGIEAMTNYIFDEFKKGTFSEVDILYPQFITLASQKPQFVSFLPFQFKGVQSETISPALGFPIFEASRKDIFESVIQKYIRVFFRKIVMETKLSEFSARTVAMEHANVKTKELIKKFSLDYTKDRNRVITQKQMESFTAHKTI